MRIFDLTQALCIGEGATAKVYRLENDAFKCPRHPEMYFLEQEFEIHKQLFEAGIRVPQPYEIVEARLPVRTIQAIRMEFVAGKDAYLLGALMKLVVGKRYSAELAKAVSLGFIPDDHDETLINVRYSSSRGIVLVDFDGWKRK